MGNPRGAWKKTASAVLAGLLCCGLFAGCNQTDPPHSTSLPPQPPSSEATTSLPETEPPVVVVPYTLPDANSINPLTGGIRPEGLHESARPVAVLVANNTAALPQRGVAAADVVYEMLTEGGITRLMAVYADYRAVPEVGPVRSARDSFVQMAADYDAILVSIGTSVYAGNLLEVLDYKAVNGINLGTTAFFFDSERHKSKSNEYCWFTNAGYIWAGMEYIDINPAGNTHALFGFDTAAPGGSESAQNVHIGYSEVSWSDFVYDAESGLYLKNHNGQPHQDEDGSRLGYTNLFVLRCDTTLKVDGVSLDFALTHGSGLYFVDGTAQPITWEKDSPGGQLRVFAADGSQLAVRTGSSYIGIVPTNYADAVVYG